MSQEKGKKISSSLISFLAPLKVTIMVSAGSGQRFRFMWAAIPFDVGQPKTAPPVAASGPGWMGVLPLLFHSRHPGAKRFPVAFRYRRLAHFLDDVGEVLKTGDRSPDPGIDHGDILAGTAQQDGSRDLLQ